MSLSRVEDALDEIRRGRAVILVDDEDRENEGDFVVAAEKITPEWVNFMAQHGRGLVCMTLTQERARELELPLMVEENDTPYETAFTVSIEARDGVTTGISAADRATTIRTAVDPRHDARHLRRPGHVFPLVARSGGVLVRAGHTEGSVDLARLAGLLPAGVICEILNEDGSMARRRDLEAVASAFGLQMVSIADLIAFRRIKEKLVRRQVEVEMALIYGEFRVLIYTSEHDEAEHLVFVKGDVATEEPVLVRMQSANVPMEALNFIRRGIESPLGCALTKIEKERRGVVVCIGAPPREERLADLLRRFETPESAPHAPSPDPRMRNYGIGAQILTDLGVRRLRLLASRHRRIVGLEGHDLELDDIVPLGASHAFTHVTRLRSG